MDSSRNLHEVEKTIQMVDLRESVAVSVNGIDAENVQMFAISDLSISDSFRFRAENDDDTVKRYSDVLEQYISDAEIDNNAVYPFPPIHVFQEEVRLLIIDGYHRFEAAKQVGIEKIPVVVLSDRNDAIRIGLTNNSKNGLPLRKQDKIQCIKVALAEMSGSSDRQIGALIGCSGSYVSRIIKECELRPSSQLTVTGGDGKIYPRQKRAVSYSPKTASALITVKPADKDAAVPMQNDMQCACFDTSNQLLTLVESALTKLTDGDQQRIDVFLPVVKTMLDAGFTDRNCRKQFITAIQDMLNRYEE